MAEILSDDIDFSEYLRETDAKSKVKPASAWMLELIDRLKNPDQTKKVLPWEKCKAVFQFRPGEVTFWAGQRLRQMQVVSQVVLSLMGRANGVVASLK